MNSYDMVANLYNTSKDDYILLYDEISYKNLTSHVLFMVITQNLKSHKHIYR